MEKKVVSAIMLLLLQMGMLTLAFNIQPVKAEPRSIIVPDDYPTIQEAINNANEGDTVYVKAGTYYENVVVNKTVSLIGENRSTTIIDANGTGTVLYIYANNVNVSGFTIRNSRKPGYGFGDGIRLHSSNNKIYENIILDNFYGIYIDKTNNLILNNEVTNNFDGIRLESSFDNDIKSNNLTFSKYSGLSLRHSDGNIVSNNNLRNNHLMGIWVYNSNENRIDYNMISDNGDGVWLDSSGDNTVSSNMITNNRWGMGLRLSGGNILRNNDLADNVYNFGVYQFFEYNLSHFINDIDSSNIVDHKPIYYWVNEHNKQIPLDAGYVAVVNSTSILVKGLSLTKNWQGVLFAFSNNSVVENLNVSHSYEGLSLRFSSGSSIANNTITNSWDGIILWHSESNVIIRNIITYNGGDGIDLYYSKDNTIKNNTVASSGKFGIHLVQADNNIINRNVVSNNSRDYPGWGIHLYSSSSNMITENTISENGSPDWQTSGGIGMGYSSSNKIYYNNLILNTRQAYNYNSINTWDDGYPSGGNYWSDYEEGYPDAQELDGSGIWDTPYVIDENNQDTYPLMKPWSPKPSSPVETTQELIETIETWNLSKGMENSLTSKLDNAIHMLDKGNENGATHKLTVFISQVKVLQGKKLSTEQANYLIAEAQRIIDLIKGEAP